MWFQSSPDEFRPDQSSCSSDTGDVLIRSTRVLPGPGPGTGPGPVSVQITVQKLRYPPGQDPDPAAPQPDRPPKENRELKRRLPAAESSQDRKLSAGTPGARPSGRDLLTSRFDAGGRELVLAALSRRSHSAPHRREVKVQVLDPVPFRTNSQNATGVSSGCLGDADAAPLIESHQALRTVTGHAPVTSDLTASAPRLQVSHLETSAGVHSNQQPSRADSITTETSPVAMATPHSGRWPEQTR